LTDTSAPLVPRPLWRRLLKPVLVIVALLVVFGWLLPQFIDYHEVWEAIKELDAWEVLILVLLGLARVPTEALIYRAFLPGLGLWRGSEAYLSSNFAGQLLPPPSASVVQYGYFRGGGYAPAAAGLAAVGSFLFPTIGRFLLPLAALVLLLLTGEVSGTIWLAGGLSLAISALVGIGGYIVLRGERSARWLGAKLQRPLSWVLGKLKRDPVTDGAEKAAELRARALAVLREGWALGSVGVAVNLFMTYVILLAALRFVGVSASELSAAEAFAAFAVAFLGRCGDPDYRQRSRCRGRRPHCHVDRARQRFRRRAPGSGAPVARLLFGHHAAPGLDHAESVPEGEPNRARERCR
jgi:putative heme transporter